MRYTFYFLLSMLGTLLTIPALSQMKEGKPKRAICSIHGDPKQSCIFTPRGGDGSFTIDMDDSSYSVDKLGAVKAHVEWTGLGRVVQQGIYTRSKLDRACWVKGHGEKICVW